MVLIRLNTTTGQLRVYELRASEVTRHPRVWSWPGGCSSIHVTASRARLALMTFRSKQILTKE